MIRRLVDASYAVGRDKPFSEDQALFWLGELRSPPFLSELVARVPELAATCARPAVVAALSDSDIDRELAAEQAVEMAADREYWAPLRRELETLRHAARTRRDSEGSP